MPVLEQFAGKGFVELGPCELVRRRLIAVAVFPIRGIAKTVDVLGLPLEGEVNQPFGAPVRGLHAPDGQSVGVETPDAWRIDFFPLDFDALTILHVLGDGADGLDRHDRDGLPLGIKGQVVLLGIRGLDGDPLAGPHGFDLIQIAVVVSVFPNTIGEESRCLIIGAVVACTDEPRPLHNLPMSA